MKYDKFYGYMILLPPPFNALLLPLLPLAFITHEATLKILNKVLVQIIYFPISLVLALGFISANIVMMPFAYFFALAHKAKLMCNRKRKGQSYVGNFLVWLVFGPIMMTLSQAVDAVVFFRHLYLWKVNKLTNDKIPIISDSNFVIFEELLREAIAELRKSEICERNKKDGDSVMDEDKASLAAETETFIGGKMSSSSFVFRLRDKLDISH